MKSALSVLVLTVAIGLAVASGGSYGGGHGGGHGGGFDVDINFDYKGKWSSWESWGRCSKTCGGGKQSRWRICVKPKNKFLGNFLGCDGSSSETRSCNTNGCPVDGMWSSWGPFRSCSKTCGGGIKKRDRRCNNPAPSNGGKYCVGAGWESAACNTQRCPVDGMWTTWGPFGPCSRKCGGGIRTRDRSCTNPRPAYGGRDCKGSAWDKQKCNKHKCH